MALFDAPGAQKCVVPVKLIGGRADETFNHCTLRVAVHYAMPGAPPLLLPAAEQQQPFQMYQQISVDGRESICDFRFRILSSQHRNAKFLLRFWLERISDNTAVPGVEVMSEAFSFVSKKRQIELKRADLLEHEKRGSRKRASGDDGKDRVRTFLYVCRSCSLCAAVLTRRRCGCR